MSKPKWARQNWHTDWRTRGAPGALWLADCKILRGHEGFRWLQHSVYWWTSLSNLRGCSLESLLSYLALPLQAATCWAQWENSPRPRYFTVMVWVADSLVFYTGQIVVPALQCQKHWIIHAFSYFFQEILSLEFKKVFWQRPFSLTSATQERAAVHLISSLLSMRLSLQQWKRIRQLNQVSFAKGEGLLI